MSAKAPRQPRFQPFGTDRALPTRRWPHLSDRSPASALHVQQRASDTPQPFSQVDFPWRSIFLGARFRRSIFLGAAWRRDEDDERDDCLEPGAHRNDVFIVEGEQLRYGSKTAWNVATR